MTTLARSRAAGSTTPALITPVIVAIGIIAVGATLAAQAPPHLQAMPPPYRVIADFAAGTGMDARARQAAA